MSIKTLFRSPIKTFLTFILLGVVTFALFSQMAEYTVMAREFNNAARQYCGVGSAEIAPPAESYPGYPSYINADPRMPELSEAEKASNLNAYQYQPLVEELISKITGIPHITSVHMRYMTPGVSDTYYRLDEGEFFYDYTARCVIEGTLKEVQFGEPAILVTSVGRHFNKLILEDCTLLAGNPTWAIDKQMTIYAAPQKIDGVDHAYMGFDRTPWIYTPSYIYDTANIQNMKPGGRYIVILRFEPLIDPSIGPSIYLSDHLTNSWCDAVWPVEGEPDGYLETDKVSPLRELIEITNADVHTFDMVYTDDMSAIMRFAEGDIAILDGRALTREDNANESAVCVVSRELAKANGIEVGDKITMKLGTELFEQYKGLGAVAATRERYMRPDIAVTLEIVGIYTDTDGPKKQSKEPNWSYSINTIFVPTSLLPTQEAQVAGHVFSPTEFSFKVENAWDIRAFLEETAPLFEAMGVQPIFYDDGWTDMARGFQAVKKLSFIKIAVLLAAVAASTGFVVYLFIGRNKKEYAVMRALGTTRKVTARTLILPLVAVAVISVLAGGVAAWMYTVKTIAHNNTLSLLKEYSINTSVPMGAAIGCIAGEILLTLLSTIVLLWRIGARSPLSLLQGSGNRQVRGRIETSHKKPARIEARNETKTAIMAALSGSRALHIGAQNEKTVEVNISEQLREVRKRKSFRFILRYIWKHMPRSFGKSTLTILLSSLLFCAVGQLALMKQSYAQLSADTVITARFVGGLPIVTMAWTVRTGYIKNPYYEARATADLNFKSTHIVITNNIARYTDEEADITYADGVDASCMDKLGETIIIGKALMEKYGLKPGYMVKITREKFMFDIQSEYVNGYRKAYPENDITDEEILALYNNEIMERVNKHAVMYTIAGVVSTPSGAYDDIAFTPGTTNAPFSFSLDVAEFTLADNSRVDEFRSYSEKMTGGGVSLVMDTSKLEHLRNTQRLLQTLYPISMTAALLIGGFLCCLVIVQSSKEAAVMRVLGTTKRRTRTILSLEQLLLSVVGLLIGACGLLLCKGAALSAISAQLFLFAALYFAVILASAVVCSALATRRNVLEFLQTKE